jgi:hypothetical protein
MFAGLGRAETRILKIIRPGVPLTVTDAHDAYPQLDYRVHRQAMQSLSRKGFVQSLPGPVFWIGVACERTTRRGRGAVAASRSELSEGRDDARRLVSAPSGDGALSSLEVRRASSPRPAVKEAPRPRPAPGHSGATPEASPGGSASAASCRLQLCVARRRIRGAHRPRGRAAKGDGAKDAEDDCLSGKVFHSLASIGCVFV